MAKRKPKGIADDIVGGIRNIMSPWLGTPPGEARQVTQGKALARTAAETLDQVYAGGMIKAGTQGEKALAKQAAINAAALGAGVAVGYGVSKAAGAAQKYGVVPRLLNKIKGETVLVHGTNQNIVGDQLIPKSGSVGSPNVSVVYSVNPNNSQGLRNSYETVMNYSSKASNVNSRVYRDQQQIVIGKTKTKNLINPTETEFRNLNSKNPLQTPIGKVKDEAVVVTKNPIDIVKVLKNPTEKQFYDELKNVGVKLNYPGFAYAPKPSRVTEIANALKAAKLEKELAKRKPSKPLRT